MVAGSDGVLGVGAAVVAEQDMDLTGSDEAANPVVHHTVRGGQHGGRADEHARAVSDARHVDLSDGGPGELA